MDTVTGWYFSEESRLLRHGDARPIEIGVTHEVDAPIQLCKRGLHASVRAIDALQYAPGPIVWRVELSGKIETGDDKCVATRRKYIGGGVDASAVMRVFARRCALDVAHLWDMPDVVREYLNTGDESLRDASWTAARAAARAAHDASSWGAIWNASRAAHAASSRDASWDASWDASRDAAWDAAATAATVTLWNTARDAQNHHLESLLMELCK